MNISNERKLIALKPFKNSLEISSLIIYRSQYELIKYNIIL